MSTKKREKREGKFAELQKYNRYAILGKENEKGFIVEFQIRLDLPYYDAPDYWAFINVDEECDFIRLGPDDYSFFELVRGVAEYHADDQADFSDIEIYSEKTETEIKNKYNMEVVEDYQLNEMNIHKEIKKFIDDLNRAVSEREWRND